MTLATDFQPDQQPARWDNHVGVYEAVFEPLSLAFARHALDRLDLRVGDRLIDIGAGTGGVALLAAARGADVLATDASPGMAARIVARASAMLRARGRVLAAIMNGMALEVPADSFDAAISTFGVILFPDAAAGMREMARVLKPGGRAAVLTWTRPERYELAVRLLDAIAQVHGPLPPPASLPAQLRFKEPEDFRALLTASGLAVEEIVAIEESWTLPSARWIADNIAFAPGMAAMTDGLGSDRDSVMRLFVETLERDRGTGAVVLTAVAHLGIARKPAESAGGDDERVTKG
ncbi:class I SAM-dependent methyltransferase [Bosea vaviloviae]|uniref:class I SAM-dependent methyltransferase n=1 Tax=Bosea vaviloviae TaxID=1526658 RepID=UPI0009E9EF65|nr:methyltransferase domain-containing protein [Bosea vaviloviae]